MIAIFDRNSGVLEQIVHSLDGVDLTGRGTIIAPDQWEDRFEWNSESRAFVEGTFKKERVVAKREINSQAEIIYADSARGGIISEQLEPAKYDEAIAFIAAKNPYASAFPLLQAEVGITASSLSAVAQLIKSKPAKKKAALMKAAKKVEPVRLAACKAVDGATTRTEITAIVINLTFPEI